MEALFIGFLILLIYYYLKVRTINGGIILLIIWTTSAYFGILYATHEFTQELITVKINYQALSYLFIVSSIFFIPILRFRSERIETFKPIPFKSLLLLTSICIVFTSAAILIYLPHFANVNFGNTADRYLNVNTSEFAITKNSMLGIVITIARALENLTLILFFYFLTNRANRNPLITILLFLLSLLPILASIIASQRNYLIFYLLNFIFLSSICYKLFPKKIKTSFKYLTIVLIASITIFFGAITLSRFSNNAGGDVVFFLNSYLSQGFINFSSILWDIDSNTYGDTCFPVFRRMLGLDYRGSLGSYIEYWSLKMESIPHNLFYTFIGDLYKDFGAISTFIIAIVSALVGSRLTRTKTVLHLHKLILILLIFELCGNGIFYFSNRSIYGNFEIIILAIVYIFLKVTEQRTLKHAKA